MTTPENIYYLHIEGRDIKCDATTLLVIIEHIAVMLSLTTEEPWMTHVNPDNLMSDDTYFRCDRHGAIIRIGEIPALPWSLRNLAMDKHRDIVAPIVVSDYPEPDTKKAI